MKISTVSGDLLIKVGIGVVVLGVGYFALKKAANIGGEVLNTVTETAGGILTGNNSITQNATNADGEQVTAYQDKGILGTLGAATNTLSGGYLATFGQWLGGKTYDLFN